MVSTVKQLEYARRYRRGNKDVIRIRRRRRYLRNREHIKTKSLQYYNKNREACKNRIIKYQKKNPDRVKVWNSRAKIKFNKAHDRRWSWLKYRLKQYGLSLSDFIQMVIKQRGGCAICYRVEKLYVDHCHSTGRVRGLLCNSCNLGLGMFSDSPKIALRASHYLEENICSG